MHRSAARAALLERAAVTDSGSVQDTLSNDGVVASGPEAEASSLETLLMEIRRALAFGPGSLDFERSCDILNKLVSKFEVFRRLFSHYDGNIKRTPGAVPATTGPYVLFAETLVDYIAKCGEARVLSTLLKLIDAILSRGRDGLSVQESKRLVRVLETEAAFVESWESTVANSQPSAMCAASRRRVGWKNTVTETQYSIGLIAAPTMRTRAYLQMFEWHGLRPATVFRCPGEEPDWQGGATVTVPIRTVFAGNAPSLTGDYDFLFRPGETIAETAARLECDFVDLPSSDINSDDCSRALAAGSASVIVYSGLPKVLLKPNLLANGKRYLHVHGGYLPEYRGATGFYFGLLEKGFLGNTAIWVDEGVDTGSVMARRWYRPEQGGDVDNVWDPVTRGDLLLDVLLTAEKTERYPSLPEEAERSLFYIIHPVLKHLALKRLG